MVKPTPVFDPFPEHHAGKPYYRFDTIATYCNVTGLAVKATCDRNTREFEWTSGEPWKCKPSMLNYTYCDWKHFLQILQNLEFTHAIYAYCDHRYFDSVNQPLVMFLFPKVGKLEVRQTRKHCFLKRCFP